MEAANQAVRAAQEVFQKAEYRHAEAVTRMEIFGQQCVRHGAVDDRALDVLSTELADASEALVRAKFLLMWTMDAAQKAWNAKHSSRAAQPLHVIYPAKQ